MPIRMVKDPNNKRPKRKIRTRNQSNLSGGGAGGGLGSIISTVLPFLLKKPKLLLILAVVGIGGYLLFGKSCSGPNSGGGVSDIVSNLFSTGGEFNKEVYESTEIYEPLADNVKNPLPEKVSLLKYAPKKIESRTTGFLCCMGQCLCS